jgi:hypothetical protein
MRGRAPHRQRSQHPPARSNAKRYSLLPGILLYGVLGMDIKEGLFKQPDFESFLQHTLVSQQVFHLVMIITDHCLLFQLPWMNPFPGINSVLIVDNCTIHQGRKIQSFCDQRGVQLVYLPPYWPELNPIKMCFSVLKSHFCRSNGLEIANEEEIAYIYKTSSFVLDDQLCYQEFKSCGYLV